jgi:hypothetical protein
LRATQLQQKSPDKVCYSGKLGPRFRVDEQSETGGEKYAVRAPEYLQTSALPCWEKSHKIQMVPTLQLHPDLMMQTAAQRSIMT